MSDNLGNHNTLLHHGKLLANAIARSCTERDERIRMTTIAVLGEKTFRLKQFGIGKGFGISMKAIGENAHSGSFGNGVFVCLEKESGNYKSS